MGHPEITFMGFWGRGKAILPKRFRGKQNANAEEAKGKQLALTSKQAKLLQFHRKRGYGFGIPDNHFANGKNTLIQGGNHYRTK